MTTVTNTSEVYAIIYTLIGLVLFSILYWGVCKVNFIVIKTLYNRSTDEDVQRHYKRNVLVTIGKIVISTLGMILVYTIMCTAIEYFRDITRLWDHGSVLFWGYLCTYIIYAIFSIFFVILPAKKYYNALQASPGIRKWGIVVAVIFHMYITVAFPRSSMYGFFNPYV